MLRGTIEQRGRTAVWCFTDRAGGVSGEPYATRNLAAHVGDDPNAVRANRAELERAFAAGPLSWMGPVHGVEVAVIEAARSITPNVDALVTDVAGLPLATLGADCVPVLMVAGDLVIAAHVGWRGLVGGMSEQLHQVLIRYGIRSDAAQVLLGPAICGDCYGIPSERADAIRDACPQALVPARDGGPGADIRRGLTAEWQALGASVRTIGPCTAEDPRYFSHRRDGITGRQAGVISWTS